jgi:putative membrane-bound dehydrogenase-like protein
MNRPLLSILAFLLMAVAAHAQDRPLPPREAPKAMTVPKGFKVTLFAGEPDVVQPIAFTFDDRGRLWVVECLSYPKWTDKPEGSDRVIVFEDTDGDGTFDKRTVVFDKGANLSGIELGFRGVWLCSLPNLLFVPCDFNADVPKMGKPEVVLDGWSLQCKHNVFNSLTWGPDGWLYGCNGITATSHVGKPGTPEKDHTPMNCGVWRYHPTRKVFEVFAHGTTNPFGLDFDDYGELFITNCVIGHLWHVVPGAHFERMYGEDFNPHVYGLMPSIADHLHWGGGHWTSSRGGKGVHDEAGGGHAHAGCMVYLGDNFPDEYRNSVFMCNLHGNRVNRDTLSPNGSTYVAKHAPDFLLANDPWFRGLAIKYGPDGGVYVTDWCDTGECHNYEVVDRTNGRICKMTYGKPKPWAGDLSKLSNRELVKLQSHKNDWFVRHSRRLLQEHRKDVVKEYDVSIRDVLIELLKSSEETRRLRGVWLIGVLDELGPTYSYRQLTQAKDERIRGWGIRFLASWPDNLDAGNAFDESFQWLRKLAEKDASAFVRLNIAAALQRVPVGSRWGLAEALLKHGEDASDSYLPLMYWYAVEQLAAADPARTVELIGTARIAITREYLTRRLVALSADQLKPLVHLLATTGDPEVQRDVLRGMYLALSGVRQVAMPSDWRNAYAKLMASVSIDLREQAMKLAVLFGDEKAIEALRKTALNTAADKMARESALQALLSRQKPDLIPILQQLLDDPPLRQSAIRGLAAFNDPSTPDLLLKHYADLSAVEKEDAVQTLASRPAYASALLDALEKGQVPRADVSAVVARQVLNLKDKQLAERLGKVWGQVRPASQERAALTAKYKGLLTPEKLQAADASKGRTVFAKTCASCHKLYDAGGDIGPALTGSQRANLDYILENVLDPNAVVANEYRVTIIRTTDGRFLNGIVKRETDKAVTVQTANELVVVPKDEVEERRVSNVSMMPEGLFDKLTADEVRDLVKYLQTKEQVPMPK